LAVLQSVWPPHLRVLDARPELVLVFVIIWAALRGVEEGVTWAFIGGLALDLCSAGPLGMYPLALVAAAYIAGQPWGQALGPSLVRLLLVAVASALVYQATVLIVMAWMGHPVEWGYAFARVAGPSVALTVGLVPFVRVLLVWIDRRITGERFRL